MNEELAAWWKWGIFGMGVGDTGNSDGWLRGWWSIWWAAEGEEKLVEEC